MGAFLALAGLLAVLTLAFVLRPVWTARRPLAIALAAAIVVGGGWLYRTVGTPVALDPAALRAPATLDEAVARLEAQLARDPAQAEGWRLLARAYLEQERVAKAGNAYARAVKLSPGDANLLVEAAAARATTDPQRRFDATAVAMLRHALQVEPRNQRARWFLGIAQRQAGSNAEAAMTWEPLLAMVDAGTAATLRPQIDAARTDAGLPPLRPEPATTASAPHALAVRVALDPGFVARTRLRGDASVFVIARVPGGPPMPVAVEKHSVRDLPLAITLDDSDGPMPTRKLSAMTEVEVFARLSASGDATRRDGDIDSKPVRVELPAPEPVELVLGGP